MIVQGFAKIHRQLMNWEWYTEANTMRLFIHCVLKANFEPKRWRGIDVKRGQFVTSINKLAIELELTPQNIRTALKNLENTGELTRSSTSRYTLLTVVNYSTYQDRKNEYDTPPNKRLTNDQQTANKRLTNDQQTANKRLTTTKNDKNDKNKKNDKKKERKPKRNRFVPPTLEQAQSYCKEKGWKLEFAQYFIDANSNTDWKLNSGKGGKMKDWKAAMRTWMAKDYNAKYIDHSRQAQTTTNDMSQILTESIPARDQKSYTNKVAIAIKKALDHPEARRKLDPTHATRYTSGVISKETLVSEFGQHYPDYLARLLEKWNPKILETLNIKTT